MFDLLSVSSLTYFRMQVVAVVVVFHILRGIKGSNKRLLVFSFDLPHWVCLAFWFVYLCRTLGKGSVRMLY